MGFVRNELLPLDTPMGTVSTGPLVSAWSAPTRYCWACPPWSRSPRQDPLSWTTVLLQAVSPAFGARAYLAGTTDKDRVELHR